MDAVVRGLYQAAAGIVDWQEPLAAFGTLMGAEDVLFMGFTAGDLQHGRAGFAHAGHLSETDFHTWTRLLDDYEVLDARAVHGLRSNRAGIWFDDEDIATAPVRASSRFYNEVLPRVGLQHALSIASVRSDGREAGFAIHRTRGQGPFGAHERVLADELAPHLEAACRIWLQVRRRIGQELREAFLGLRHAAVLILREGRVAEANPAARRILGRRDGLYQERGRLRCTEASDEAGLAPLLAPRGLDGAGGGGSIWIRRPAGAAPWRVSPLSLGAADAFGERETGLLIEGRGLQPAAPREAWIEQAGLTPSETRVVEAILFGRSMRELARERGTSEQTVKAQKRAVFAKLDVHSEAEIVRRAWALGYGTDEGSDL